MPSVYELLPSREYFNHQSSYASRLQYNIFNFGKKSDLNYSETKQFLKDSNLNSSLIDKAELFHSSNYDNFDFSGTGIKTYNIVGCQEPTLNHIIFKDFGPPKREFGPGDGTVPVISANNIFGATTFFALDSNHSTMLTADGIRQQILNLITGSNLSTNGKITQSISDCHFNGTQVSSHSPVSLHIYDGQGNHVGTNPDGSFDYQIPGIAYDVVDHDSTAFLPSGKNYIVKLVATGTGSFSFDSAVIQEGNISSTAHYDSVPIATSSIAQINFNSENNQPIQLDSNGDGTIDQTIQPSSILDPNQSQDLISPISTSTIVGLMGTTGFYRSNATVTLSAIDPIIPEYENQTSGMLKTMYKVDEAQWQICPPPPLPSPQGGGDNCSIVVTSEGQHTIRFYSTDRAGNNERIQEKQIKIDKTPAEFVIFFDVVQKDIAFSAVDNLSKPEDIKKTENGNKITFTDLAGNTTELMLKEKDRKRSLSAELVSLSYNGKLADVTKNRFGFAWVYDKKGILKSLTQHILSKKDFALFSFFDGKNTRMMNWERGIKPEINTYKGLKLINIKSNQGKLI